MEPKQTIIDNFEIPFEVATQLTDLLTKQTIRMQLLQQNLSDPVKFEEIEKLLMPITSQIEALKRKITDEYVPAKYRFPQYMWNYDGYDISGCVVQVIQNL